jgi:thioredoxin 1
MGKFDEMINSTTPTLVDFYATWCGPCKMMSPLLEQVATEMGDETKIIKIDIDKNRDAAAEYGIRSVPTLLLFKEGEIVWRQSGLPPKSMITESIKKFI